MSAGHPDQLVVAARFNGPPRSANGGYVAGLLAHELAPQPGDGAVQVTLLQPPPLDTPFDLTATDEGVEISFGGAAIARAARAEDDVDPVPPVEIDAARAASAAYPGHSFHPFPTCFVCGVERDDGLRIFPGPVEDGSRVAATWTPTDAEAENWHEYAEPTERSSVPATWASLDCIGGWAGDLGQRLMVLGRMTAVLDDLPAVGEPHVVVGESRGRDGRKTHTASTLYDPDGRIVARARHTWLAVDPATFNPHN